MSNQRKDMDIDEARDYVKSKTADAAKKVALAGTIFAIKKLPGAEKVTCFFTPKIDKLKTKIPEGLEIKIDPFEKKGFIGFKIPLGGNKKKKY